jgi:hypothetical protein
MSYLVHRCDLCKTFNDMTGTNTGAGSIHPLPLHFGLGAGLEEGGDMVFAESERQDHICDGSEQLARVTEVDFCLECEAPVPLDFVSKKHSWHTSKCSLHAPSLVSAH